jgi:hypothetical protein
MEQLPDGRIELTPAPDTVVEFGTDINKELLQLMEDRIVMLMNRVFNDLVANPFTMTFTSLDGITVSEGIWNATASRIEC